MDHCAAFGVSYAVNAEMQISAMANLGGHITV